MDNIKRAIKFQNINTKWSLLGFWAVILIVDLAIYFIGINNGSSYSIIEVSTGINMLALIVLVITYNFEVYHKRLPLALSFSMTRKDFFKSFIVDNLIFIGIISLIQGIIIKIEILLTKDQYGSRIYDMVVLNNRIDNIFSIIFFLFISFLAFSSVWNIVASLIYRFGKIAWIIPGGIIIFFNSILKINLIDLVLPGEWLNRPMDFLHITRLLMIILICHGLSYFIVKNTEIKYSIN